VVSTSLVVLQLQELWLLRLGPEPSRSISWAAAQQLLWPGVLQRLELQSWELLRPLVLL
jgi:hypothetical protein